MILQRYKIIVLNTICTPYGSFYYVYKFIYDARFFQDCDFVHILGLIINSIVFSSMSKGFMC
jgi:hypothetical protein